MKREPGKKVHYKYLREDDIITATQIFEPCPTCNGLGYLRISEEVRRLVYEILEPVGRNDRI
jgi:hypothetical protein